MMRKSRMRPTTVPATMPATANVRCCLGMQRMSQYQAPESTINSANISSGAGILVSAARCASSLPDLMDFPENHAASVGMPEMKRRGEISPIAITSGCGLCRAAK